jgi:hypothetical protein
MKCVTRCVIKSKMKTTPLSSRSPIYLTMSVVGLLAVFIGFAKTFFLPVMRGTFTGPVSVHVHGAFALSWILLFFVQTLLIRTRNFRLHRTLGYIGIFIAFGVTLTIVPAALFQVERELTQGLGDTAISSVLGSVTSALLFLSLVLAGVYYRRAPQAHKSLMLLSIIVVLWPAWFRFRHYFPSIPRPEIWLGLVLADSLIIITMFWQWIAHKSVNRVFLIVGLLVMIEQSFEIYMFDTYWWRIAAKHLYAFLV